MVSSPVLAGEMGGRSAPLVEVAAPQLVIKGTVTPTDVITR